MSSRYYVQDLSRLRAFSQYLSRFASRINETLSRSDQSLRAETDWIEDRKRFWAKEVQRRQRALDDCRAETDSGGSQGCYSESQALAVAQESLAKAQIWAVRIEQAIAEYEGHAKATRRLASADISKASSDLSSIAGKYEKYLASSGLGGADYANEAIRSGLTEAAGAIMPDHNPMQKLLGSALGGAADAAGSTTWKGRGVQLVSGIVQSFILPKPVRWANAGVQIAGHFAADVALLSSVANERDFTNINSQLLQNQRWHQSIDSINLDKRVDGLVRSGWNAIQQRDFGVALNGIRHEFRTFFGK